MQDFVIENGVLVRYEGQDSDVIIPKSITSIGEAAFFDSENVTIKGTAGSYAETYAKNNGIAFEEIE